MSPSAPQSAEKENFFLKRIRTYQVLTFTLGFLFLFRFTVTLISYFVEQSTFIKRFDLNIGFFLIAIPAAYLVQWLIVTWVASKYTCERLREKFYRHPISTMIFTIFYITNLPYRLSDTDLGGGFFIMMIGVFEKTIYYAFLNFLWWLLLCWVCERVWKKQKFEWVWYKKSIEKAFIFLPLLYKFILGLMIALMIFSLLFVLLARVFSYSGADLQRLLF